MPRPPRLLPPAASFTEAAAASVAISPEIGFSLGKRRRVGGRYVATANEQVHGFHSRLHRLGAGGWGLLQDVRRNIQRRPSFLSSAVARDIPPTNASMSLSV